MEHMDETGIEAAPTGSGAGGAGAGPGGRPTRPGPGVVALPTGAAPITASELDELLVRLDDATDAYIRGDVHRYLSLFDHGDEYSLMPPYGGPTTLGFEYTEEGAAATSRFFASGHGHFELQRAYVAGDVVVLVGVERQHGEVGGLPDQDWSLRLSLVLRRVGDRWTILHRHADPLVQEIPFEHCARLARGLAV